MQASDYVSYFLTASLLAHSILPEPMLFVLLVPVIKDKKCKASILDKYTILNARPDFIR